jgi:hypothetical protein
VVTRHIVINLRAFANNEPYACMAGVMSLLSGRRQIGIPGRAAAGDDRRFRQGVGGDDGRPQHCIERIWQAGPRSSANVDTLFLGFEQAIQLASAIAAAVTHSRNCAIQLRPMRPSAAPKRPSRAQRLTLQRTVLLCEHDVEFNFDDLPCGAS